MTTDVPAMFELPRGWTLTVASKDGHTTWSNRTMRTELVMLHREPHPAATVEETNPLCLSLVTSW